MPYSISDESTRKAWKMAAIYRCCIRYGMEKSCALAAVRKHFPDGSRDQTVEIWFQGMENIHEFLVRRSGNRASSIIRLAA